MLEWLSDQLQQGKLVCGATTAFLHSNLTTKSTFNKNKKNTVHLIV